MYAISMLLIQLFIWQFLYSDDYDDDYIDDQHNSSADDQYDSFVYMCNFIFSSHLTCFRHELVYCVTLYFGIKTNMSAIRRFALGKMPIIVIYVARCKWQRKHYVHTEKTTIQMMYVMLYFCIVWKLYKFLTYIMYIWTKNVSWFTWYCTLL